MSLRGNRLQAGPAAPKKAGKKLTGQKMSFADSMARLDELTKGSAWPTPAAKPKAKPKANPSSKWGEPAAAPQAATSAWGVPAGDQPAAPAAAWEETGFFPSLKTAVTDDADALWVAPPAISTSDWSAPEADGGGWDAAPSDSAGWGVDTSEGNGWGAPSCDSWQPDTGKGVCASGSNSATVEEPLVPEQRVPGLQAWLAELKLPKYFEKALEWCDDQGAVSVEECIENGDDFADSLQLKVLERKRFDKSASDAWDAVSAKLQECHHPVQPPAAAAVLERAPAAPDPGTEDEQAHDPAPALESVPQKEASTSWTHADPTEDESEYLVNAGAPKAYTGGFEPTVKPMKTKKKAPSKAAQKAEAEAKAAAEEAARRKAQEKIEEALRQEELDRALQAEREAEEQARKVAEVETQREKQTSQLREATEACSSADDIAKAIRSAPLASKDVVKAAQSRLTELRTQERELQEALAAVDRACDGHQPAKLRAAIKAAREAGVDSASLSLAMEKLQRLEAVEKQRADALRRVQDAVKGEVQADVRAAIQAAIEAGVPRDQLASAKLALDGIVAKDRDRASAACKLDEAVESRCAEAIGAALKDAVDKGVDILKLDDARAVKQAIEHEAAELASREADLRSALECGELEALDTALDAARQVKCCKELMSKAGKRLAELNEEAACRAAQEAAEERRQEAEAALRTAVDSSAGASRIAELLDEAREAGVNDSALLERAKTEGEKGRLDAMVDEARRTIGATEEKIAELEAQAAKLTGKDNRKARSAALKEALELRTSDSFVEAQQLIKDPEKEYQKMMAKMAEREERDREQRETVKQTLDSALASGDISDLNRAVLEGQKIGMDVSAALKQLNVMREEQEEQERLQRERAENEKIDSCIVEFVFPESMVKRDFFTAVIDLSEMLDKDHGLTAEVDFRQKQISATPSVVLAFRDAACAKVALKDFDLHAEGVLLRAKPVTGRFSPAAASLASSFRDDVKQLSEKYDSAPPAPIGRHTTAPAAPVNSKGSRTGAAAGSAWGTAGYKSGKPAKGGGDNKGKGKGKGKGKESSSVPRNVLGKYNAELPDQQRRELVGDLQIYSKRFLVSAELEGDVVTLYSGEANATQEMAAQEELQKLLKFYLRSSPEVISEPVPLQRHATAPADRSAPRAAASPPLLTVPLIVDPELGAGIDVECGPHGYQVVSVDDMPGQKFEPGDIIIAIAGKSLAGLEEEEQEEIFGENFEEGAVLQILKASR